MNADISATTVEGPPSRPPRWRPGVGAAALGGLVAIGLGLALAEVLSLVGGWLSLTGPAASPLTSLGQSFIGLTPEWLKQFAISTFGQNDKVALTVGMGITVAIVAAVIGVVARWRLPIALGLAVLLLVVGGVAIISRAGSGVVDLLPLVIGGIVGLLVLVGIFRPVPAAAAEPAPAEPAAAEASVAPKGGADRRRFFTWVGAGAVGAVVAGAAARFLPNSAQVVASRRSVSLPVPVDVQQIPADVALDTPGLTPFVTDNAGFYRVDTAFVVPQLTTQEWQLRIHGLVDREITLDYAALTARPSLERMITLTCVSNPVGGDLAGNATWQGVRLADLLAEAGPQAGADCVLSTSVDGFTVTTPLDALTDDRDALLAYAMNGEPLPVEHGFPVRMVVPGLYGYVSATKWVVDLEVTKFADVSAYWTDRGWAPQAPIKTASRIDVPAAFANLGVGPVMVGGMAWAQHRGISAVQVRIDGGEWQDATLSGDVSIDTWRQWEFQWDADRGQHTIECRAIDGTGTPQVEQVQGTVPDGATGLDSRVVMVTV